MEEGLLNDHNDRRLKIMVAETENCIGKVTSFSHLLLVNLTEKSYY